MGEVWFNYSPWRNRVRTFSFLSFFVLESFEWEHRENNEAADVNKWALKIEVRRRWRVSRHSAIGNTLSNQKEICCTVEDFQRHVHRSSDTWLLKHINLKDQRRSVDSKVNGSRVYLNIYFVIFAWSSFNHFIGIFLKSSRHFSSCSSSTATSLQ